MMQAFTLASGVPLPTVQLSRVSLRGSERDPLRARQQLARALARVDWQSTGVPTQAVLLVRRLAVQGWTGVAGDGMDFSRTVSATLQRQVRGARRPWLHADSGAAEAVLFADETELAACLVSDWLRGAVGERWWWRSVLGRLGAREWLHLRVLPRGEVLVPTLALLASRAEAVRWVARLAPAEAKHALASVVSAYSLSPPEPAVAPSLWTELPDRSPRRGADAPGRHSDELPHPSPDAAMAAHGRLVRTVPEVRDSALGEPQRRLLAAALAVARAPAWARTTELPLALAALEHHVDSHLSLSVLAPSRGHASGAVMLASAAAPNGATPDVPPTAATAGPTPARPGELRTDVADRADRQRRERLIHPPAERPTRAEPQPRSASLPIRRAGAAPEPPHGAPTATGPTDPRPPPALPLPAVRESHPAAGEPFGVGLTSTGFGGIFYLLNAALALELYGDFTAPRTQALALLPWNWLALVGRSWFGKEFVRDPVWEVLAGLSGRGPHEPPDAYFAAPREWRLPPAWLAPWGTAEVIEVKPARQRLRVLHPAGFLVADVPREPALQPLTQARALCDAHAELRSAMLRHARVSARCTVPRLPTRRWLRWLLDFLRARVAMALGLDDPVAVPAFLCRHNADVGVSGTRVDVYLSLAELPLPIRIAGLDRDAGWIPAAGRSLHFHFA
jgi:hypothetical protein